MGTFVRRFWIPVLRSEELPGPDCDPKELRILGEYLVAFRDSSGRVGLFEALCPHRRAPLFYGRNEEDGLRCIYHGWKFDVEGRCVDMPTEPLEFNFQDKVRAEAYPAVEAAGIIWAYMGPPDKRPPLPEYEWMRVAPSHRYYIKYHQRCNFVQAMEGDIDPVHGGFLHSVLGGSSEDSIFDRILKGGGIKDDGLVPGKGAIWESKSNYNYVLGDHAPRYTVKDTPYGMMGAAAHRAEPGSLYWRVYQWLMPYHTMFSSVHGHLWVPIDDENTAVWCTSWSTGDPIPERIRHGALHGAWPHVGTVDPATSTLRATRENHFMQDKAWQRRESYTGIRGTREQDTAVVEGMGALLDRSKEHLGTSDTIIIAMRRRLLGLAKALARGKEPPAASNPALYRVRAWAGRLPGEDTDGFLETQIAREQAVTAVP
jgi:phenylpropionate dioxygenase-like ring-hydroxylating dioxygenase large terminal subunit